MFKKYIYLCLISVFLLLNTSLTLAETKDIQITSLETQIMPEYDTADILIVNSIKFTNKSNKDFTGEFKWRVPKGSLKQVVTENANGNNHLQVNVVPSQAFDELVWKLNNPLKHGEMKDIHLEFYYNNLQGNPDKKFTYDFIPAYPVISAKILLLQPTKASNLKITPDFGQPMSNQGWTYYMKTLNNLAVDQATNLTVTYTKSDPSPSVVGQQQSGQNQNNQSAATTNSSNDKVWIFAAAAIAIVIVLAVTYTKVQRNNREDDDYEDEDYEDDVYEDDELEDENTDEIDFKMSKSQKSRVERINNSTKNNEKNKDTSKLRMLENKKKELRRKLEEGLITDVDYYEAVMELEEEGRN